MALIISNFVTDHDEFEENQEQMKRHYTSGKRGKKSNRLRNLFISSTDLHNDCSFKKSLINQNNCVVKTGGYLNNLTDWRLIKFSKKFTRYHKKHFKTKEIIDYDTQTECLL